MTDYIDAVYTKNQTNFLWPIEPSPICDENQTRQQRNQSYRFDLRRNQN